MCCFSQPVKYVGDTSIFCRMGAKGSQVVVYSMTLESAHDVAMILPVPTKKNTVETDIKFLNFKNYPHFFKDLERGFPASGYGPFGGSAAAKLSTKPPLKVQTVGNFEASLVPEIKDFERLDPRFRLPEAAWDTLPQFARHSFVVFKLKAGNARVDPMAFAYPAADPNNLVFPTVHIHDGLVHKKAAFDHTLFCQTSASSVKRNWQESVGFAATYINNPRAHFTTRSGEHIYRRNMIGRYDNEDIIVSAERV